MQKIFLDKEGLEAFLACLVNTGKKIFIVSGKTCKKFPIVRQIIDTVQDYVIFSDFSANPDYESVKEGVTLFNKEQCDTILAIGGGSAIDVAKCVKAYSSMDSNNSYLEQEIKENAVTLFAIPTTAGTGSESTRFAVIYANGVKQSVTSETLIPSYVLLAPELLESLPPYQRKVTMLDALCHGIESLWSVNATQESIEVSVRAIKEFVTWKEAYLQNTVDGNRGMLRAANFAGQAINMTQTTAAHAMSYKITSLYGIAHGHAAAICLPALWKFMLEHFEKCVDTRGKSYVLSCFQKIAQALGCNTAKEAVNILEEWLRQLELDIPHATPDELQILVNSVNPVRLKNNPIKLEEKDILEIYQSIFKR